MLAELLCPTAKQIKSTSESAYTGLRGAGIDTASCVLALGEDDLVNLRFTIAAHAISADTPVVLRAFDPVMADQFEQGLNVRRAFSVSGLSAPAFAAAACGSSVIESLRLGDEIIPISIIDVASGCEIDGLKLKDIASIYEVSILAILETGKSWHKFEINSDNLQIASGMKFACGGPNSNCLRLANASVPRTESRSSNQALNKSRLRATASYQPISAWIRLKSQVQKSRRSTTWMPKLTAVLMLIILSSVVVFKIVLHLSWINAIYFVITTVTTTGYGDITVLSSAPWVKLYNGMIMLTGGALLGVMFSYLAAVATAERLDMQMGRRAQNMKDHIVVVGLGNVGFRTTRALVELKRDVCVMDASPRERFAGSLGTDVPVLRGDSRQPEILNRLGIKNARAIIACTSDELVNIETCLHAKRINPGIRTIARVFDETMAGALSDVFQIDRALNSNALAESAFVAGATDEQVVRRFKLGELNLSAGRVKFKHPLTSNDMAYCTQIGMQFLGFKSITGSVTALLSSADVFEAIVVGEEGQIRELATTSWQSTKTGDAILAKEYNPNKS